MKRQLSVLLLAAVLLSPSFAGAQFVPINQAKQQLQEEEQGELGDVLSDITSKGASARRQVAAVFSEAQTNSRVDQTVAERRVDSILAKLKEQLNKYLNDYAKKSPSGTALRSAFKASQDTLNDVRRQADEGLDQVQLRKQADPKALSGKYLDYQKKIKPIAEKAIKLADERLGERGTKASTRASLDKLVADTQTEIENATNAFIAINADVLMSAIQRVKKGVLDELSTAMAARYKQADARGSDKALDLTEEEQAVVEAAKKEMSDAVDRAIQSADSITRQVASSNLPTTSNTPGVNPLLEAKYKAQRQIDQIKVSVGERLDKIVARYKADKNVSALLKEIIAREGAREKNRLNDNVGEYIDYFKAGDPTRQKYNRAKRDAQEEAEGCTSFLCSVGNFVADVGSAFIGVNTGGLINIPGSSISGLVGIRQPNPYATSRYQTPYSYNSTFTPYSGVYGNQAIPYGNNCFSQAPSRSLAEWFAPKAHAQVGAALDFLQQQSGSAVQNAAGNNGNALEAATNAVSAGAANARQPSWLERSLPFVTSVLGGMAARNAARNPTGFYGSNPCAPYQNGSGIYNYNYTSPFGMTPTGQLLGYPNNNLFPSLGSNPVAQLQMGFQIAAQQQSGLNQILPLLSSGQLTYNDYQRILNSGLLRSSGLPNDNPFWQQPYQNLARLLCTPNFLANPAMMQYCRSIWQPVGTPPFNPNSSIFPNTSTGNPFSNIFGNSSSNSQAAMQADPSYQTATQIYQGLTSAINELGKQPRGAQYTESVKQTVDAAYDEFKRLAGQTSNAGAKNAIAGYMSTLEQYYAAYTNYHQRSSTGAAQEFRVQLPQAGVVAAEAEEFRRVLSSSNAVEAAIRADSAASLGLLNGIQESVATVYVGTSTRSPYKITLQQVSPAAAAFAGGLFKSGLSYPLTVTPSSTGNAVSIARVPINTSGGYKFYFRQIDNALSPFKSQGQYGTDSQPLVINPGDHICFLAPAEPYKMNAVNNTCKVGGG